MQANFYESLQLLGNALKLYDVYESGAFIFFTEIPTRSIYQ